MHNNLICRAPSTIKSSRARSTRSCRRGVVARMMRMRRRARFRIDYKILPTTNLSKEAWQYYKRGLVRLPKRLGSKGCWAISSRKIRCPKKLGNITKEAWKYYKRGLERLPKRLGKITKEAWKDYQRGLEIFSRWSVPMIAGSLLSYVDCLMGTMKTMKGWQTSCSQTSIIGISTISTVITITVTITITITITIIITITTIMVL